MKTSLYGLAFTLLIFSGTCLQASINPITYGVDEQLNSGAAITGYITTDGNSGYLSASDITGWSLTYSGIPGLTLNNVNSYISDSEDAYSPGVPDVFATSQALSFDFSNPAAPSFFDFDSYPTTDGNDNSFEFNSAYWVGDHSVLYIGQDGGKGDNFVDFNNQTGTQVIATATPEPGFYGLLTLGLGGIATVVSRRKRAARA